MDRGRCRSILGTVMPGLAFIIGTTVVASADPEPANSQCDHIHVKGHVRTQSGQGVGDAALEVPGGGPGGGGVSRDLPPFVQGVPARCDCGTPHIRTAPDGSYELKIRVGPDAQCTSAIDRITIDKSKMFWKKPGVSITPAP